MTFKVYYGDTDAAGVVYYANYLRWLEAARCESLASLGFAVTDMETRGVIFAVTRVEIDYEVPARLGDEVEVVTTVGRVRRVRFVMGQTLHRVSDGVRLASAQVTLACLGRQGKAVALPEDLAAALRDAAA